MAVVLLKVGSYNVASVNTLAGWQSGYAAACKAVDAGSIPTPAFLLVITMVDARVAKLVDARDLKSLG